MKSIRCVVLFLLFQSIILVGCGGSSESGESSSSPSENTSLLTIATFYEDADTPAGSGVLVKINDEDVGVTNENGNLRVPIESGTHNIRVIEPGVAGGRVTITLSKGETRSVSLIMGSETKLQETASVSITEVNGQIIDHGFTTFTLQFKNTEGNPISLAYLSDIITFNENGKLVNLTPFFALQPSGVVEVIDIEGFKNAIFSIGSEKLSVNVNGEDSQGLIYEDSIEFFIGYHAVHATLVSPPSNPDLPVSNIPITISLLGTELKFEVTSDLQGNFTLPSVPKGVLNFSMSTVDNGLTYNGFGAASINGDKQVKITLLTTEDVLNGVDSITITPLASSLSIIKSQSVRRTSSLSSEKAESSIRRKKLYTQNNNLFQSLASADGISITVVSVGENERVTDHASLTVPAGTQTVTLKYIVRSAEYPGWVLQQSIYNDVWEIGVMSEDGMMLFPKSSSSSTLFSRKVNSQLYLEPTWQSGGTTGEIVEQIDVSSLTVNETQITVFASSTNIGDNLYHTMVMAYLSFDEALSIKSVKPVPPTTGNIHGVGNPYSIPRPTDRNTYHRYFDLEVTRPEGYVIHQVVAELRQSSDQTTLIAVADLFDSEGTFNDENQPVRKISDNKFRVQVTLGNQSPSIVNSAPPLLHNILYHFVVYAGKEGASQTELFAEKDSASQKAIWRMPDNFDRFGHRDQGHDDWCAKGTYEWLVTNQQHVKAINDISGEHGRNIGHQTHIPGTDIDMYHFVNFLDGARNGTNNYLRLRQLVVDALNGDEGAESQVENWITATRQGISNLAALNNSVSQIISALGSRRDGLARGWARTLLENGSLTARIDGIDRTLDFQLESWSEEISLYRNDHNDHIHITLNAGQLNNSP